MGYWQCPRCGSHEVFQGTEVVGSSGGSVSMMNEHGVSLSRNTGMQTKQVQVIKCKACGEILSEEHNYHYTAEDLAQIKAKKLKEKPRRYVFAAVSIFFALACVLGVGNFLSGKLDTWGHAVMILIFGWFAWFFRPWKEDIWE